MHFLVLGGTGQNGTLIIQEALARGHSVTAMMREPASFRLEPHAQLTIVKGTPESQDDTKSALTTPTHPDAVIVALGLTANSPRALLTTATESLLGAIRSVNLTTKIVVNSSQGVGASGPSLAAPFRLLFSVWGRMRLSQAAHEDADRVLMAQDDVPFVVARPSRLTEGPAAEVKVFGDDGKGIAYVASISRASVAKWLVSAAEMSNWDGKAPVLSN
ncbi:hypothetical protein Micbo1qcDRAFT_218746 [Microdochium bolleyi]|uniref:NAD(P)-binding domain-containing protein n=1 Tax=Microdochium bolleyi TaxID=196109 RepID=A0A136IPW8_9PEZI|nr:hypothetical protein Micbo1qcDRAFT_218746 [Microdochium bolleyi]